MLRFLYFWSAVDVIVTLYLLELKLPIEVLHVFMWFFYVAIYSGGSIAVVDSFSRSSGVSKLVFKFPPSRPHYKV